MSNREIDYPHTLRFLPPPPLQGEGDMSMWGKKTLSGKNTVMFEFANFLESNLRHILCTYKQCPFRLPQHKYIYSQGNGKIQKLVER